MSVLVTSMAEVSTVCRYVELLMLLLSMRVCRVVNVSA